MTRKRKFQLFFIVLFCCVINGQEIIRISKNTNNYSEADSIKKPEALNELNPLKRQSGVKTPSFSGKGVTIIHSNFNERGEDYSFKNCI